MGKYYLDRYQNIEEICFDIEVVTPMFLKGAEETELRAASIKGALRFWWRALYGSDDIKEMKQREGEIFGDTSQKSLVILRLEGDVTSSLTDKKLHKSGFSSLNYLAYGATSGSNVLRKYIKPKTSFKLHISFPQSYRNEVLNSFYFLCEYGGIGSRSRNGYGSILCKDLPQLNYNLPNSNQLKNFTALSSSSKILYLGEHATWENALSQIGDLYKTARFGLKNKNIDRAMIALPFKDNNDRHSKSYFFSITKKNNRFQGQILYLPYKHNALQKYMKVYGELNNLIANSDLNSPFKWEELR